MYDMAERQTMKVSEGGASLLHSQTFHSGDLKVRGEVCWISDGGFRGNKMDFSMTASTSISTPKVCRRGYI